VEKQHATLDVAVQANFNKQADAAFAAVRYFAEVFGSTDGRKFKGILLRSEKWGRFVALYFRQTRIISFGLKYGNPVRIGFKCLVLSGTKKNSLRWNYHVRH
jgi:hypothetical protein